MIEYKGYARGEDMNAKYCYTCVATLVYVGRPVDPANEKSVAEMGIMSQVELLVNH